MMGVLESNIDQLPIIAFLAMLVHLASKKLKKFHVEGPRQQSQRGAGAARDRRGWPLLVPLQCG